MGAGGYQDLFVPDFMFRLNMLQHRYPNYIEPTMVDQWSADVQEVRRMCFVQQRTCYWTLSQHAVQWGSDAVGMLCSGSDVLYRAAAKAVKVSVSLGPGSGLGLGSRKRLSTQSGMQVTMGVKSAELPPASACRAAPSAGTRCATHRCTTRRCAISTPTWAPPAPLPPLAAGAALAAAAAAPPGDVCACAPGRMGVVAVAQQLLPSRSIRREQGHFMAVTSSRALLAIAAATVCQQRLVHVARAIKSHEFNGIGME